MMEFPYKIRDKIWITMANDVIMSVEITNISEDWIEVKEISSTRGRSRGGEHTYFINKNAIQYMSLI